MDAVELDELLGNCNRHPPRTGQILPSPDPQSGGPSAWPADSAGLDALREEVRRLAADLAAVDQRDAAQHGGLKGELAHVVRRIVRLESTPRTRQSR